MDLVGTCPKTFWKEWLEEGCCAGDPGYGLYSWNTRSRLAKKAEPFDRFYVVAHGRLRGYATILCVLDQTFGISDYFEIVRGSDAVSVTIQEPIPGFQGLRKRWWERDAEIPFPEWKKP